MNKKVTLFLLFAFVSLFTVLPAEGFAHCGMCGSDKAHDEGMSHMEGHEEGFAEDSEMTFSEADDEMPAWMQEESGMAEKMKSEVEKQ